jgi:hypothetical protein
MFNGSMQVRREQPDEDEARSATAPFLTERVTEIIRVRAFEGLKALPRRGAEVGGLITSAQ